MVRPSALAVLRLMTSSNLVGACTGRSARLFTLEDTIDVDCGAPVLVDEDPQPYDISPPLVTK